MGVIRKDANDPDPTSAENEGSNDGKGFESLVVLQFREDVTTATVEWLLGKIQASRFEGGAELMARTVLNEKGQVRRGVNIWDISDRYDTWHCIVVCQDDKNRVVLLQETLMYLILYLVLLFSSVID